MLCAECKKETSNPKFCGRKCANTFTNRTNPKRKLTQRCQACNILVESKRTHCKNCTKFNKDMTIEEASYTNCHKSGAHALIRFRARTKTRKLKILSCDICGYDKHVETHHIKPISSFSVDTLLSVVNDITNLQVLCPNHHWEVEHGLI
jgi:hypothetical protein